MPPGSTKACRYYRRRTWRGASSTGSRPNGGLWGARQGPRRAAGVRPRSGGGRREGLELGGDGLRQLPAPLEGAEFPTQALGARERLAAGRVCVLAGALATAQQKVLDGAGADRVEAIDLAVRQRVP